MKSPALTGEVGRNLFVRVSAGPEAAHRAVSARDDVSSLGAGRVPALVGVFTPAGAFPAPSLSLIATGEAFPAPALLFIATGDMTFDDRKDQGARGNRTRGSGVQRKGECVCGHTD